MARATAATARIWGGEFLMADYKGFERVGHLEYVPLPGGAAAIRAALPHGYQLSAHAVG